MWLNINAKSMCFLYLADKCIIEVYYFEPKRTHLDYGCWRWCKCYICGHCEFVPKIASHYNINILGPHLIDCSCFVGMMPLPPQPKKPKLPRSRFKR